MTKKEKKEKILTTAEMYKELDERDKIFINGYLTGKREERAKWERKPAQGGKAMFLKKLAKLFKKEEGTIKVPSKTQEEIEKEKFLRAKKKYELKEVTLLCKGSPRRVRVALSMPYPDWCELQNSESWKNLLRFYEEKRSEDIQSNYTKEQLTAEIKHL